MVLMRVDLPRPVWPTQMTLNWKPRLSSFLSICWVMLSKPTWLLGKIDDACCCEGAAAAAIVNCWERVTGFEDYYEVKTDEETMTPEMGKAG